MSSCYELSALDLCWILVFCTLLYKSSLKIKDFNIFAKGKYFWAICFSLFTLCILCVSCRYFKFYKIKLSFLYVIKFSYHLEMVSPVLTKYILLRFPLTLLWFPFLNLYHLPATYVGSQNEVISLQLISHTDCY